MKRIEQIKIKVEALVEEAIAVLEENYDMDSFEEHTGAYMIMLKLNSAVMRVDEINEEGLKIEKV
jgi:hypothetical protein